MQTFEVFVNFECLILFVSKFYGKELALKKINWFQDKKKD